MRSFVNPFRQRATEHLRDDRVFLRNFALGMLNAVPSPAFSPPLVFRSAPGSGKTSMMRLFTAESLMSLRQMRGELRDLHQRLQELGAVDEEGTPLILGTLLNLERDYSSLPDVGAPPEVAHRLFLRLLDARIMSGVVRAACLISDIPYPNGAGSVTIETDGEPEDAEILARLLPPGHTESGSVVDGWGVLRQARAVEGEVRRLLHSLEPVQWEYAAPGHLDLYSLRALSASRLNVNGQPVSAVPLVMLDDGHEATSDQRNELLRQISKSRRLRVGLWYAERLEAMTPREVMVDAGEERRDHRRVDLGGRGWPRGAAPGREQFDRILLDLADQRAAAALDQYAAIRLSFRDLLEEAEGDLLEDRAPVVNATLDEQLATVVRGDIRYERWLKGVEDRTGYEGALARRELQVLVHRHRMSRQQEELFIVPLSEYAAERRSSSQLRDAVRLRLAYEHDLPYYFGVEAVPRLGNNNLSQFLDVAAELFDQIIGKITMGKPVALTPAQQHTLLRRLSARLWQEIPTRYESGRDVQALLLGIARFCQKETFTDRMSYNGVTGIALRAWEHQSLLEPEPLKGLPEGQRLVNALGVAIANNLLVAEPDRQSKGEAVTVLYLNRLLCPNYWLSLNRGGYRRKRAAELLKWMQSDGSGFDPEPEEQLTL